MRVEIKTTADAVVHETWTLEVTADEWKRIKSDPEAAMELLEHDTDHFVSVENTDVDGERDREFVGIERVTERAS